MSSKLLEIIVFKEKDNTPYPGANVSIGGYSNLSKTTDENGKASIVLPFDTGEVSIYVNGTTAYSGYVSEIPAPLIVKAYWSAW